MALGSGVWAPGSGLWALSSGLWALGSGLWALGLWALGWQSEATASSGYVENFNFSVYNGYKSVLVSGFQHLCLFPVS